jgi:thiamine-phosphate diphosphorylase
MVSCKIKFTLPRIYPITDKTLARRTSHFSILKELVRGGATVVQIRDKTTPLHELLKDLRQCAEYAHSKEVALMVNDRCDLVLSSDATGVHLGQDDLPAEAARAILGQSRTIGLSTHSLRQVKNAAGLPIQYIGFGPVFATSTKPKNDPVVGLNGLSQACAVSSLPVVAIGGIGLPQIGEVLRAGASSVAVISALMKAENLAREMQRFLEKAMEK